jgi:hypothetical protein
MVSLHTDGRFVAEAKVAADRTYGASGLPAGDYRLAVRDASGQPRLLAGDSRVRVSAGERATHDLALLGTSLTGSSAVRIGALATTATGGFAGRVTGADTGLGLSDVWVNVYDLHYNWVAQVYTDANGDYAISTLSAGTYYVRYSPSPIGASLDYASLFYGGAYEYYASTPIIVTDGQVTTGVNVVLWLGSRIAGTVTAEDTGAPLADVRVWVSSASGSYYTTEAKTDSLGHFRTEIVMPGAYRLQFVPSSVAVIAYIGGYYNRKPYPGDVVTVSTGQVATITTALQRGGQIAGYDLPGVMI